MGVPGERRWAARPRTGFHQPVKSGVMNSKPMSVDQGAGLAARPCPRGCAVGGDCFGVSGTASLNFSLTHRRIVLLRMVSPPQVPLTGAALPSPRVLASSASLPRGTNVFQLQIQPATTSCSLHLSFGSGSGTSSKINRPLSWTVCPFPPAPPPVTSSIVVLTLHLARVVPLP